MATDNDDFDRDDPKTGRTLLAEEAQMRSLSAESRSHSVEKRVARGEERIKRVLAWWSIAGIMGTLLLAGWIARAYMAGKANADELERVKQTVSAAAERISVIESEHREEQSRLARIENKIDRVVDWVLNRTTAAKDADRRGR